MERLAFKATSDNMCCRGEQYKMRQKHRHDGALQMCRSGFHFCPDLMDVIRYYPFPTDRVFVVQHGANFFVEDDKGVTDEIEFLCEVTADTLQELLRAPEYSALMAKNMAGLFELCGSRGDTRMYNTLLTDACVDARTNSTRALQSACYYGQLEIVALLLQHGADVNFLEGSALSTACAQGHRKVAAMLLQHGADVHAGNDEALLRASQNGYSKIVALLLDHGADVHARDDEALRLASANERGDVMELLLNRGADVHASDDEVLRVACLNGRFQVVELLLNSGADVHVRDDEAVRLASANGNWDVVALLLQHGADVHACDDEAVRFAYRHGHRDVVALLLARCYTPLK